MYLYGMTLNVWPDVVCQLFSASLWPVLGGW